MKDWILILSKRTSEIASRVLQRLFHPRSDPLTSWVWLLALYLGGGIIWGFFLNWGRIQFDLHDWTQEGPRLTFLRQVLMEGQLPLHIGSSLVATDRFLAIPDTLISPQVVLLRFLLPERFVLVNSLFLYSIGFLGLLLLRRRFQWSLFTFTVVFLLFSLNGHPMAHIAVGHSMWVSYFLLPFFGVLVFDLVNGRASWAWTAQMALLQLGFFLQGGFHFVIWSLMFLLLLGIFHPRFIRSSLKVSLFSLLLSAVRILPAALTFAAEENRFISGYFSLSDLLGGFITLKPPSEAQTGMYTSLGWWEVDIYTGLLGFSFLALFGLYLTWKTTSPERQYHRKLLAPIIGMTVLSIGKIYQPINALPIPLINAERVSARFLIIPVFIAIVLGGVSLERMLRKQNLRFGSQLFSLTLVGVMAHDLLQHARLWRVENMATLFERTPVNIRTEIILRPDPGYVNSLLLGLGISFLTLIFLIYQSFRESRSAN